MVDDVVTPSNPLVSLIKEEEFEEPSLDVNVFQRLCDEKPFQIVVRI